MQQPHNSQLREGAPHRGYQVARRQEIHRAGSSRNQPLQDRRKPSQPWAAESASRPQKPAPLRVLQSAGIAWAGVPLRCSHSSLQRQHQQSQDPPKSGQQQINWGLKPQSSPWAAQPSQLGQMVGATSISAGTQGSSRSGGCSTRLRARCCSLPVCDFTNCHAVGHEDVFEGQLGDESPVPGSSHQPYVTSQSVLLANCEVAKLMHDDPPGPHPPFRPPSTPLCSAGWWSASQTTQTAHRCSQESMAACWRLSPGWSE